MTLRPWTLLVLAIAAVGGACGFDPPTIDIETPPLIARPEGTTPRDSTEYLHDQSGLPLVVNFNREFTRGEVTHVQLVPMPPDVGPLLNPGVNPRQLLLESVVFEPRFSAYRLVLDGPAMPEPVVISYYSAGHEITEGAMHGHVAYPRWGREPLNVMVYALLPSWREDEVERTGSEELMFGRPVLGVTRTIVVPTEEGGWFRLAGLELGAHYFVVGILDTNDDGRYDPEIDWWGYYRNFADHPIEVMAGVSFGHLFTPPLPPLNDHVDFAILEPGSLDAPFD
jgi:hypothetical protein